MGRQKRIFAQSAIKNIRQYNYYLDRLCELGTSMFEWSGVPDTVDVQYLERQLYFAGRAVFFYDEVIGYLALKCGIGSSLDVYGKPTQIQAIGVNGYQAQLDQSNSVMIYNNIIKRPTEPDMRIFAEECAELDRIISVNARAQKTPVLIKCNEKQRLTLENVYMQWDGNEPIVWGDETLDTNGVTVLRTDAPYVGKELTELKVAKWNEALTTLGISNANFMKRERLISDEVLRSQGGTVASRYSRLDMRQTACKQINDMFGLNMWCEFKDDYKEVVEDEGENSQGEEKKGKERRSE